MAIPQIGHPWIDESRAPLYVWSFPPRPSDEELAACCAARERWASEARFPVARVVDLANLGSATPLERRLFVEHLAVREARHPVEPGQRDRVAAATPREPRGILSP